MQLRHIALAGLLFAAGCNKGKEAAQAAAAKSAQAAEIDERAGVVAQALIDKAAQDAEAKRAAAKQQETDALKQVFQQAAMEHPGKFLEASKLQMTSDARRHLTSISLTNSSKFSMINVRGTVDYHGGADSRGADDDVVAHVPVELSGAIAPGASMVFSEAQHTLAGAAIQLPAAPSQVTFTVTGATVGSEGIDTTPPDGGVPDAATP